MTRELIVPALPRRLAALSGSTPSLFLPNAKAAERFSDSFTANIRNRNTRRAYYKAACRFADWCEGRGVTDLPSFPGALRTIVGPLSWGGWATRRQTTYLLAQGNTSMSARIEAMTLSTPVVYLDSRNGPTCALATVRATVTGASDQVVKPEVAVALIEYASDPPGVTVSIAAESKQSDQATLARHSDISKKKIDSLSTVFNYQVCGTGTLVGVVTLQGSIFSVEPSGQYATDQSDVANSRSIVTIRR